MIAPGTVFKGLHGLPGSDVNLQSGRGMGMQVAGSVLDAEAGCRASMNTTKNAWNRHWKHD
jgi:hypothetical protein